MPIRSKKLNLLGNKSLKSIDSLKNLNKHQSEINTCFETKFNGLNIGRKNNFLFSVSTNDFHNNNTNKKKSDERFFNKTELNFNKKKEIANSNQNRLYTNSNKSTRIMSKEKSGNYSKEKFYSKSISKSKEVILDLDNLKTIRKIKSKFSEELKNIREKMYETFNSIPLYSIPGNFSKNKLKEARFKNTKNSKTNSKSKSKSNSRSKSKSKSDSKSTEDIKKTLEDFINHKESDNDNEDEIQENNKNNKNENKENKELKENRKTNNKDEEETESIFLKTYENNFYSKRFLKSKFQNEKNDKKLNLPKLKLNRFTDYIEKRGNNQFNKFNTKIYNEFKIINADKKNVKLHLINKNAGKKSKQYILENESKKVNESTDSIKGMVSLLNDLRDAYNEL